MTAAKPPLVFTADGLAQWAALARRGDTVVYFSGNIAQFRHDAPLEIVRLQQRIDGRSGKSDGLAATRVRITKLQRQLELITCAQKLFAQGLITFSQRRDAVTRETTYIANRLGGKMSSNPLSPAVLSTRIQSELRNAITSAWMKFRRDFQIAHIGFEGNQDNVHNTTAVVEVFSHDRQRPTHIRIPYRDLGEDRSKWPPILEQKGTAARKQIKARDGLNRGRKTLDDIPD